MLVLGDSITWGQGLSVQGKFWWRVKSWLQEKTGREVKEKIEAHSGALIETTPGFQNHFEAQHAKDAYVEASGHLKTLAVSLSKIANDIRWLGSGPRCGIGELVVPAVQPGSSIMPGKVNPVICEALIMACCQVIGNDVAITYGGFGGVGSLLDLNVAMPMMAANMLESIHLLTHGITMFTNNLLGENKSTGFPGLQPDG